MGLVLIQLETSVDTVNDRNNCLSEKKKNKNKNVDSAYLLQKEQWELELRLCVSRASGNFLTLYKVPTDKSVKMKTRRKLVDSCVMSMLI